MYYAWVGLIMSMNQAIIALFEMNKFKYRIEKIPEKRILIPIQFLSRIC